MKQDFVQIVFSVETPSGIVNLQMRIGIHSGRFLTAEIGTPRRMEHVLLGKDVQKAKLTESNGRNERVNVSQSAYELAKAVFRFEDGNPEYHLVQNSYDQILNVQQRIENSPDRG